MTSPIPASPSTTPSGPGARPKPPLILAQRYGNLRFDRIVVGLRLEPDGRIGVLVSVEGAFTADQVHALLDDASPEDPPLLRHHLTDGRALIGTIQPAAGEGIGAEVPKALEAGDGPAPPLRIVYRRPTGDRAAPPLPLAAPVVEASLRLESDPSATTLALDLRVDDPATLPAYRALLDRFEAQIGDPSAPFAGPTILQKIWADRDWIVDEDTAKLTLRWDGGDLAQLIRACTTLEPEARGDPPITRQHPFAFLDAMIAETLP